METEIDGAFINAYRIANNKITGQYFWIKLSEIKLIEPYGDNCIIRTFKDCAYFVNISDATLRVEINRFIFNPENCFYSSYEN